MKSRSVLKCSGSFLVLCCVLLLPSGLLSARALSDEELISELSSISQTLGEASELLNQGLSKVENSLDQQEERLSKLDERLLRVEGQLSRAEVELMTSGQALESSMKLTQDLTISFNDYKRQTRRELLMWKILGISGITAAVLAGAIVLFK